MTKPTNMAAAALAAALKVDVTYFFDGLEQEGGASGGWPDELLADREALDLVRTYYAIPEAQRKRLFDLARALTSAA